MQELSQVVLSFGPQPTYVEHGAPGPYTNEELGWMWLDWVGRLNPDVLSGYDLVLLVPKKTVIDEGLTTAWRNVRRFDENSGVQAWPLGPNRVFQQIQWFYYHDKLKGAFLWCEPDCVPVKPDWLTRLSREYARCNKPFMGGLVEAQVLNRQRIPKHLTGNAIYPDKAYSPQYAPKIMEAGHTPWDVYAAEQILPKSHFTNLIQHEYRHPEIKSAEKLGSVLKPEAVLFHSDKFGAIARILSAEPERAAEKKVPHGYISVHQEPFSAPREAIAEAAWQPPALAPVPGLKEILDSLEKMAESDDEARRTILEFCSYMQSKERSRIAREKFQEFSMKFQVGDALSTLNA